MNQKQVQVERMRYWIGTTTKKNLMLGEKCS